MKCASEFRDRAVTDRLLDRLHRLLESPLRVMEVCGTHTVSIFRHGIRGLVPPALTLVSGPGCPVCVTPAAHVDGFVQAASRPGVLTATFGDLLRVPGSRGSLAEPTTMMARHVGQRTNISLDESTRWSGIS